jgi:hypothetical protein
MYESASPKVTPNTITESAEPYPKRRFCSSVLNV